MLTHRQKKVSVMAIAALLLVAAPSAALAHEGHDHGAEGGGEMPPAGAVAPGDPAPGAQPAAPDEPAPAADAAAEPAGEASPVDVDDVIAALADTTKPVAVSSKPIKVASGGGTGGAAAAPASGGGGPAVAPASSVVAGSGELPFTGVEDNILLISLAGMLAPMGVLLYCAARRGDVKLALAMPRFTWASPREPLPDPVTQARIAREEAARRGAAFDWATH